MQSITAPIDSVAVIRAKPDPTSLSAAPPAPSIETARSEIYRHAPERVLLVGLDVGKDVNVMYMRTLAGLEVVPATKLATLTSGYTMFWHLVEQCLTSGVYTLVLIGHEPTGVYHEAWSHQLAGALGTFTAEHPAGPLIRYRLLHPTLVKRARQNKSHRTRKSDAIDAAAMTDLLAEGGGRAVTALADAEWEMRHRAGALNSLIKEQKRQAVHLLRTFDRLWPGALGNTAAYARTHPDLPPLHHLVDSKPLERQRLRLLLTYAITPAQLAAWGVDGIRDFYHSHDASCGEKTARHILQVAQQSLLPPPFASDCMAQQLQSDFTRYTTLEGDIEHLELRLTELLPHTPAAVLTTLPGVSPILAARYLAALGNPARFESAQQIWAFAGLDPVQADSGNRRFSGAISHRGSPFLRYVLYQMGFLAAQHCPDCARLYYRTCKRGKAKTIAILHVANKVNRILWHLLQTQQPYRSPLSPAQETKWRQYVQQQRRRTKHGAAG